MFCFLIEQNRYKLCYKYILVNDYDWFYYLLELGIISVDIFFFKFTRHSYLRRGEKRFATIEFSGFRTISWDSITPSDLLMALPGDRQCYESVPEQFMYFTFLFTYKRLNLFGYFINNNNCNNTNITRLILL